MRLAGVGAVQRADAAPPPPARPPPGRRRRGRRRGRRRTRTTARDRRGGPSPTTASGSCGSTSRSAVSTAASVSTARSAPTVTGSAAPATSRATMPSRCRRNQRRSDRCASSSSSRQPTASHALTSRSSRPAVWSRRTSSRRSTRSGFDSRISMRQRRRGQQIAELAGRLGRVAERGGQPAWRAARRWPAGAGRAGRGRGPVPATASRARGAGAGASVETTGSDRWTARGPPARSGRRHGTRTRRDGWPSWRRRRRRRRAPADRRRRAAVGSTSPRGPVARRAGAWPGRGRTARSAHRRPILGTRACGPAVAAGRGPRAAVWVCCSFTSCSRCSTWRSSV